jgi:hypothetical protein
MRAADERSKELVHPLYVRVTHWINALAVLAMSILEDRDPPRHLLLRDRSVAHPDF